MSDVEAREGNAHRMVWARCDNAGSAWEPAFCLVEKPTTELDWLMPSEGTLWQSIKRRRIAELYEVMRTTSAVRHFTNDPLPDEILYTILDNARFAPSGGNRQGTRIVIIRDPDTRQALVELTIAATKKYVAQRQAGENPLEHYLSKPRVPR
jgi:hypothetical protein